MFKQLIAAVCAIIFANQCFSDAIKPYDMRHYDKEIVELYHKIDKKHKSSLAKRIEFFSAYFLDKPYVLGPLGEGMEGKFDQDPLYRTEQFDCLTYVSTVTALAVAKNLDDFKHIINKIRYKEGKVAYINRNHFTSKDWNINNQKQGYLVDITRTIKNKNQQQVAVSASAIINKPAWYQHFKTTNLALFDQSKQLKQDRLAELKKQAQHLPIQKASIDYLPLTALFNKQGQARRALFKQIPNASIIEIVRPNWNLKQKIGTCLNVSHLGFGIWKNNTLYFREASLTKKRVIDIPLDQYLKSYLNSPTIKGINIQQVRLPHTH